MKYRNPILHQCVDKYEVRKYIENKSLSKILNKTYGVYESFQDIDFDKLPEQFVIKTTTGGGGQNVIIVRNKNKIDIENCRFKLKNWTRSKNIGALAGREWAYAGCRSRIIVEELLKESKEEEILTDYKFFCFNGEPKFLYVITDRKPGEYAHLGIYDINFKKLSVYRCDERRAYYDIDKPKNYEEMVKIARKLSKDFPHVRVDLYNIDGKIFFGELTFYDGSGYFQYDPDIFDMQVGSYFTEYQ